ncbi:hypothetical protein BB31_33145 [Amycolatopsis lurida NRRL 2430]|uniref:Uncharacterized protein n=1 Tax=Amycolatopsis lurida NRRL 2430 TaxID=1460371 RepID=A0A2P2FJQ9_AMYLU|nr:hypothetical protein BB31_33145 [Amycolatopsis lurida NRRL 2430]
MFAAVEVSIYRMEIRVFRATFRRPLVCHLVHSRAGDSAAQTRQGRRTFAHPSSPRLRRQLERSIDRRLRAPSFVHPSPVELIILRRKIEQSQIEYVVDESGVAVSRPLNDSFGSLDDTESTELDMPLRSIVTSDRSEYHQRHGEPARFSRRRMMELPSGQERPVTDSLPDRLHDIGLMIPEVTHVPVVQIKDIVPRRLL